MHSIRVHKVINQFTSLYYYSRIWHRGDGEHTARELPVKLFYSVSYLLYLVSLVAGAIKSENADDKIFAAEVSFAVGVLNVKFWILIWKQNQILDLLNRICTFSIRYDDDLQFFNDKLRGFIKFVIVFCTMVLTCTCSVAVKPFFGSEKTLLLEIGFPLDYKGSEIAFWIAHIYFFIGGLLSFAVIFYSIIIWYFLLSCSLRYDVLGRELKKMGQMSEEMTQKQKHTTFMQDLKASIDAHLYIRELANDVESFFTLTFFIQFGTSSLCICGSIYCLAFGVGAYLVERVINVILIFYFISELLLITYFGNEILMSSNRLSYSLFESNWTEQPQATKKCLIIFWEHLQRPHELMIGKLYPLTLDTFTRILKSAYGLFNILKSFQK